MSASADDPIFHCIQNASEQEVRQVLAGLCTDGLVRKDANKFFIKLASENRSRRESGRNGVTPTRYICITCRNAYTEEENSPRACRYHPGDLEFWEDSWHWQDIKRDQIGDTEYMRARNPGGFMWTCCDEYGVEAGCRPCSHTQGGSKPEPEEEEEQSSESSAGAEAARHAAHNPRKRRRAEVIVISDDDDSGSG